LTQLDVSSPADEAAVDPPPASSNAVDESRSARWLLLSLAVGAVSLLAVWMISPRFEIDVPSVVDDWAAYFYSPDQLADVLRLTNPETERFRPSVILWGYLQWHTFGAPQDLFGPNVWNVLRVVILVGGLTLFTAVALPVRRGKVELALYVGLASIPAFVVVLVPKFARDLARFGPQEPLLVGGMALGGSLLFLAARSLLDTSRPLRLWGVTALAVAGGVAWALGTYQKETSICVLPLLAGVAIAGWSQLAGWKRLSGARKAAVGALGAVVLLPVLHVAIETLRIAQRGDLVYDAEVGGGRGLLDGVRELWNWTHEAVPENARLLAYGAVVLTVIASIVRRRVDPIAAGALLSGALTFVFAGQSGVVATRYYIPVVALFAVAFALSLARLPTAVAAAGVLAVFFSFMPPPGTREEVQSWTDEELANGALVREASELESAGCVVAAAGLDLETSVALPVLVGIEQAERARTCPPGARFLVVGPGEEGMALASACVPSALERLREAPIGSVYRCERLRSEPIQDPTLGLVEPEQLVAQHRLQIVAFGDA
jgi:hypothetical protein